VPILPESTTSDAHADLFFTLVLPLPLTMKTIFNSVTTLSSCSTDGDSPLGSDLHRTVQSSSIGTAFPTILLFRAGHPETFPRAIASVPECRVHESHYPHLHL
jgi:hypothetical protein